jgi:hypothetical protein
VRAGYFLTLAVLINITAIQYAPICYPFDPYSDCTNIAMETIIAPDKRPNEITDINNFSFIAFTRREPGCTCVYNFTLWFTCRY